MLMRWCQGLWGWLHRISVSSCARLAVGGMAFELLQPVFCAEQRVEIKGEACVDPLGFNVNGPEQVRLPADIKAVESYHWQFEALRRWIILECPQSVLSINDLYRVRLGGCPARTSEASRKNDGCCLPVSISDRQEITFGNGKPPSPVTRLEDVDHNRRRKPTRLP